MGGTAEDYSLLVLVLTAVAAPLTCALTYPTPTVSHDSLAIVKVENSSYELRVNLTCEPWDKGSEWQVNGTKRDGSKMNSQSIDVPEPGSYSCVADYPGGLVISQGATVEAYDFGQDSRQLISISVSGSADDVTLNCSAEGFPGLPPGITVTWYNVTEVVKSGNGIPTTNSCADLFPPQRKNKDNDELPSMEPTSSNDVGKTSLLKEPCNDTSYIDVLGRLHIFGPVTQMKDHTFACVLKLPGCNLWQVYSISPSSDNSTKDVASAFRLMYTSETQNVTTVAGTSFDLECLCVYFRAIYSNTSSGTVINASVNVTSWIINPQTNASLIYNDPHHQQRVTISNLTTSKFDVRCHCNNTSAVSKDYFVTVEEKLSWKNESDPVFNITECEHVTLSCETHPSPGYVAWFVDAKLISNSSATTNLTVNCTDKPHKAVQCFVYSRSGNQCISFTWFLSQNSAGNRHYSAIFISVAFFVAFLIVVCILLRCRRLRRLRRKRNSTTRGPGVSKADGRTVNVSVITRPQRYTNFPLAQNQFSVRLRIHEVIGEGNFGRVFRGEAKDIVVKGSWTDVAIKMCKEDATDAQREDLLREMELLSNIPRHSNIVTFLGSTITSGATLLIEEFVNGPNLLHFLRKHRPDHKKLSPSKPVNNRPLSAEEAVRSSGGETLNTSLLSWEELASLALQVAKGMEHLAAFKIVHRDLAARNVLVDENRVCKICDFGLARFLTDDNVYEKKSKSALPIRWMAPEALKQNTYTTKSDVWSYGVVVWEIITLGACPWPKLAVHEVIARVMNQDLLPKPDHCSDDIYSVMQGCWENDPVNRLTFSRIRARWESMLEQNGDYLQLDHIDYEMYSALEPSSGTSTLEQGSDDPAGLAEVIRKLQRGDMVTGVENPAVEPDFISLKVTF